MAGGTITLPSKDDRGARLVEGAVRLHADLGQLLVPWRHSPRQALARLHVLAASAVVPDSDALGRPRPVGAPYDDPVGLGPAPDPVEVAARLDGLARVLTGGTSAPAVVVAGVVHGELMALRAVRHGGRTGRPRRRPARARRPRAGPQGGLRAGGRARRAAPRVRRGAARLRRRRGGGGGDVARALRPRRRARRSRGPAVCEAIKRGQA
jgi:hypothetical protein